MMAASNVRAMGHFFLGLTSSAGPASSAARSGSERSLWRMLSVILLHGRHRLIYKYRESVAAGMNSAHWHENQALLQPCFC